MGPRRSPLAGGRLHFQHGPIDLVIGAEGEAGAVQAAHEAAWQRFAGVLAELVAELPLLRAPVGDACPLQGVVARRMWAACAPYRQGFITPMAAVAGAVAQDIAAHYARDGIARAWVNNGGDIALHLAPGRRVRVGLFADIARLQHLQAQRGLPTDARFTLAAELPVRGVATSGWRGRSFSLGIADSVTVLARDAAMADAAATVIANAVDALDARIVRRPANTLRDDTDLGARLVTVDVPPLPAALVEQALDAGLACAHRLRAAGLIWHAALACQGRWRATEGLAAQQLVQ
ncbi:UPF0280 family protein [Pseudorhodoferax sp.]|uniref:UPF0280 family protein n=1 Tax=Pseudorhodoferax sp. TaxID=1993553 RepID=UPI0039E2D10F